MSHTPGPWTYDREQGVINGPQRPHAQSRTLGVSMVTNSIVAYVRGHHGSEEADANGAILGNSLALLEALEDARDKGDWRDFPETYDAMCAAIAAARGQS